MTIRYPVQTMVARTADALPADGRHAYEPKFDGYRCVAFRTERGARLQSRQQRSLTDAYPGVVAAVTAQFAPGTVVDGELVVMVDGRVDFAALQRRDTARVACLVVFDVLAEAGTDMRRLPYLERRERLEQLLARVGGGVALTPMTFDVEGARAWLTDHADDGIEGVVAKSVDAPYAPGRRWWAKVRTRHTVEVVVGGVTGPIAAPSGLIVGRQDGRGRLRVVGRTLPLPRAAAAELTTRLRPPAGVHPWPELLPAGRFGERALITYTRVEPDVVVEVQVDTAFEHGRWRHPVRYVRPRPDLIVGDLSRLG